MQFHEKNNPAMERSYEAPQLVLEWPCLVSGMLPASAASSCWTALLVEVVVQVVQGGAATSLCPLHKYRSTSCHRY